MVAILLAYAGLALVSGFVVMSQLQSRKFDEKAALKRARARRASRVRKYKPPVCINGVYYGRLISSEPQRTASVPRHDSQKGYW